MGRAKLITKGLFTGKRAVTLIELLIVTMVIMVIFGGCIVATITMMQFLKSEAKENIATENLVNAFEWIKKDAMASDTVTINGDSITLSLDGAAIEYYVEDSTHLYRSVDSGPRVLITDMIDANPVYAPNPRYVLEDNDNYLSMGIWIKDPDTAATAHSWAGVMLCRSG